MVWTAAVLEAQVVDQMPVMSSDPAALPTPAPAAVTSNRISGVDVARGCVCSACSPFTSAPTPW